MLLVQGCIQADVEVVQVAVVDADERSIELQGTIEFGSIMDLDENIEVILAGAGREFCHLGIGQCSNDEQDAVGADSSGFKDLPGIDGEVLAQHRQGNGGACLAQEVVVALEVLLIRQHRQAGGPTLFIAARKRHGIEVGADDALAGAGLLDLGDDGSRRLQIGGSLGGMQALQWAIDYPDRVRHALVIASATRLSAQNIAFNDVARQAIITDPDFHEGHYRRFNTIPRRGLRIARMMGHITYLAEEGLGRKFGRSLHDGIRYGYGVEFEIESYLRYQGDKFAERFDANTYLRMTKVLDYFSPAAAFGNDLVAALRQTKAKFFVASFTTDWRFAPARSRALVKHLVKAGRDVQYIEVESNHGHDAFLMTDRPYIAAVAAYMDNVYKELQA